MKNYRSILINQIHNFSRTVQCLRQIEDMPCILSIIASEMMQSEFTSSRTGKTQALDIIENKIEDEHLKYNIKETSLLFFLWQQWEEYEPHSFLCLTKINTKYFQSLTLEKKETTQYL